MTDLLNHVGTHAAFDFGEYVFEKFMKNAKSYVVKFPIGFPSLICCILVKQKKDTTTSDYEVVVVPTILDFSY